MTIMDIHAELRDAISEVHNIRIVVEESSQKNVDEIVNELREIADAVIADLRNAIEIAEMSFDRLIKTYTNQIYDIALYVSNPFSCIIKEVIIYLLPEKYDIFVGYFASFLFTFTYSTFSYYKIGFNFRASISNGWMWSLSIISDLTGEYFADIIIGSSQNEDSYKRKLYSCFISTATVIVIVAITKYPMIMNNCPGKQLVEEEEEDTPETSIE